MAETTINAPTKTENTPASTRARRRFEGVRREIGSLVEDFFGRRPSSSRRHSFLGVASRRAWAALGAIPAVHLTETDKAYEITSELPGGMGGKDVKVKFANGVLTIKGEKQEEREETKRDYHMQEQSFGSFEPSFQVSGGVDAARIKTSFRMGRVVVTPAEEGGGSGANLGTFGGHALEDMRPVRLRQRQGADAEADHVDAVGRPGKDGDLMGDRGVIGRLRFPPDPLR